jgi:signal transduction histidine kinase
LDLLVGRLRGHDAAADADRLRDDLRGTVAEVRRVVEGLRPPALDELGLVGALQQVTRRMTAGSSITVCLEDRVLPPLSAAVEVAAFRIVTEAVTNVVKHAEATTCRIELRAVHGRLCISVDDDGNGGAVARARSRGHGMQTMAERAEELRGEVRVTAGRPCGTRVTAELPLPPAPVVPRQYPPAEVIR